PERVRVVQLGEQLEVLADPDAIGRGGPLADAVHREYRGLLEGRRVERAGSVRFVVLREENLALETVEHRLVQEQASREELFLQPHRHCGEERPEAARAARREMLA